MKKTMKRMSLVLVSVFMVMTMLVSCNMDANEKFDGVGNVSFASGTKALSSQISDGQAGNYYWAYAAKKLDNGGTTGQTAEYTLAKSEYVTKNGSTWKKGLEGINTFSVGKWEFTLWAFKTPVTLTTQENEDNVIFKGTATATVAASTTNHVPVNVYPYSTGTAGKIQINVSKDSAFATESVLKYKIDDGSWTALTKTDGTTVTWTATNISSTAGSHTVYVGVFDSSTAETPIVKSSILINVYRGLTTLVTGTVDDLTGGVKFVADYYEIQKDGSWKCALCTGDSSHILKNTDKAYITVLDANGQPGKIIALDSSIPTEGKDVGTGKVTVSGSSFTYTNTSETAQTVVIRTDSFETKLTVNAPLDTVAHYGYVSSVDVNAIKGTSYDEYGTAGRIEVRDGHVEAMAGCEIFCLMEAPATDKTVAPATVNQGAVVHTNAVNIKGDKVDITKDEKGRANGHVIDCGDGRHSFSQLVIDSEHVYDVCTCCGYTLVRSNGVKTTAPINETTGEPEIAHIAETSELASQGNSESLTCQHSWTHEHEGEQCITKCSKCEIAFAEDHDYFDEANSKFFAKCPVCDVTLGTEEIPWYVTNEIEFSKVVTGYYKQTQDITFTSDKVASKAHDCVYDGNGHKAIVGYNDSYHYKYLFHNPYTSLKIKNLDFYSNDTTLCVLLYNVGATRPNIGYGDINLKLSVENCNARSLNGTTIELAATNATVFFYNNASMNYSLQGKYTQGVTEISFKNCNNYVNFYNKSASASVMMALPIACDDWAKTEFINCNNYGVVQSDSAAGLISSHLYTNNYANYWTAEQLVESMTVEGCNNYGTIKAPEYVGMFCDANGDNNDKNGKSFIDALNTAFDGLGQNYVKVAELTGEYTICYDNNTFEVITENSSYEYKLRIGFGKITTPGAGFSNTSAVFFDLNKIEQGTTITANKLHAYDIESAIEAGIVSATEELHYEENNAYHVALKTVGDTLYIIFSAEDNVIVDTSCSFGIYAYSNGQSVGYKNID